jgi:hypothetical protein
MLGILGNHERWSRVVSVLCVVLVLAMGTVQAVHAHPDSDKAPRHTCSICSASNAKLNTANVSPVPVMVAVPMASVETSSPEIFRPVTTHFVRPPPAA